jgi:hypothetical protein
MIYKKILIVNGLRGDGTTTTALVAFGAAKGG